MAKRPSNIDKGRKDFLDESDYFMSLARLTAMQSKDTKTQVGACIINQAKNVIGLGYNKMPNGCEEKFSWARGNKNDPDTKYPYVCHAELNAIVNSNKAGLKGSTMYVTLFPCNECAKIIIQSGIKSLVYLSDKNSDNFDFSLPKKILETAEVNLSGFKPTSNKIVIDFEHDENNGTAAKKPKTG